MPVKKLLSKLLGDPIEKGIRPYKQRVNAINALEPTISQLSDAQLAQKTVQFKSRIASGESLDEVLVEAFACIREAGKRVLSMRHFDVQLIGGMVLHEGNITEMKTGEGKTLVASLPAYLNALEGKGVYVVTVNDYLAKRDSEWMGQLFTFMGLSVGLIQGDMSPQERTKAYHADITYGTNNEFGFDYLRDNLATDAQHCCQTRRHFAIIDEVDSILVDEARTPLIISGPVEDSTKAYKKIATVAKALALDTHFTCNEKQKNIVLTEAGIALVEEKMGVDNIYSTENLSIPHKLLQCLKALHLYKKDTDYVIKDGQIIIVDEFTGRLMDGRRYSDGLHQAIEAVENLTIKEESQTLASITFQNYFRMFPKLAGMTGTAKTEAAEFGNIYGLNVIVIPTNKPLVREDKPDMVFKTKAAKFAAIATEVATLHKKKQPVLIGTIEIETSEYLSGLLKKKGIAHHVLNAKQHEHEATIVAEAGRLGAVTIATNMAGRGTDIVLDPATLELGGLCVLGSARHESRRIDNQLRGRSGRQGDPGVTRFYVSLEDDLMRLFGSDRIKKVMETLGMPDDMPIEHRMITRSLEKAQIKVEKYHYGIRKQILQYDDVLNKQRETIYTFRQAMLTQDTPQSLYTTFLNTLSTRFSETFPIKKLADKQTATALTDTLKQLLPIEGCEACVDDIIKTQSYAIFEEKMRAFYHLRVSQYPAEFFDRYVTKHIMLINIDSKWRDHLHTMDTLRESIGLRAYGQRDPLLEYKREGYALFQQLLYDIAFNALSMIHRAVITPQEPSTSAPEATASPYKRNDIVTIKKKSKTKKVKWKIAQPMIETEGWILVE